MQGLSATVWVRIHFDSITRKQGLSLRNRYVNLDQRMAKLPLRENSASNTYSVTRDEQKARE